MKTKRACNGLSTALFPLALAALFISPACRAETTVFFDISQHTNLVSWGTTSDTIGSEEYLFTVTRDKLFTGGVGLTNPIGRYIRVPWPDGMEAQAVTSGPNPTEARIDIRRADGQPFAIQSFTAQLLANTGGAGAAWEIMPLLNGEDGVPNPFVFDATGYGGRQFMYNTPQPSGFDEYKMTLYVDFALMSLTVVDASPPKPNINVVCVDATTIQLSWPANAVGYVLEFATNLPAQVWSRVTNSVVTNGENCFLQLNSTSSKRFYRLRK